MKGDAGGASSSAGGGTAGGGTDPPAPSPPAPSQSQPPAPRPSRPPPPPLPPRPVEIVTAGYAKLGKCQGYRHAALQPFPEWPVVADVVFLFLWFSAHANGVANGSRKRVNRERDGHSGLF